MEHCLAKRWPCQSSDLLIGLGAKLKGKADGQLQEIMVNIIEAARERGAVGESGGWLGGASQLMSSLLNSVQSSDPPMPMGMDNFFKELYRLCQFDNVRTLHLQTLLRRDDDTMVAETFYKRQSVPSFVQTLSWKTMRTRPQHQYSLIRSSLSLWCKTRVG